MAVAPLPNNLVSNVATWLTSQGYQVPTPPSFSFSPSTTGGVSAPNGITFGMAYQKPMNALAEQYGKKGQVPERRMNALRILLHEMLHRPLVTREPDWYPNATPDQRLWEEAAAEQSAYDLLPAAAKQLFGYHYQPNTRNAPPQIFSQPDSEDRLAREKAFRQWSTLASGSRNYQDRAARVKRRAFLNASTDERAQMLAAPPAPRPAPLPAGARRRLGGPDRPPGY